MLTKILSIILTICMLVTSAPVNTTVDEITKIFDSINQKITDSADGLSENLGQKEEDNSATINENNDKEFVVTEQAAVSTWDGTTITTPTLSGSTYIIDSAAKLAWVAQQVNAGTAAANKLTDYTVKLTVDIDLANKTWTPIGGIGSTTKFFGGIFDGNGHTVSNITIPDSGKYSAGFFGRVENGTVKNLGLKNVTVTNTASNTNYYGVAGLAGSVDDSTIQNCYVRNAKITAYRVAGGLIGNVSGTVNVTNCYVQGTSLSQTNSNSYSGVGGIVGYKTGTLNLSNCYSAVATYSAAYTSKDYVGAIVGRAGSTVASTITNSYGLSGTNADSLVGTGATSSYLPSANTSAILAAATLKGYASTLGSGFIADLATNINSGYPILAWEHPEYALKTLYNEETASERIVTATANIIKAGVPTEYNTYLTAYNAAKSIVTDSAISSDSAIETAYNNLVSARDALYNAYYKSTKVVLPWNGSTSQPKLNGSVYEIYTAEELAWLAAQVNGGEKFASTTFNLMKDINLNNKAWTPIGGQSGTTYYFNGTFNGNNHLISGLNVNLASYNIGLFGYTYTGTVIKNVGLVSPTINGTAGASTATERGVGALVGTARGSTISYCFVRKGSVTTSGNVGCGGLIGSTDGTAVTVTYCYVEGTTVTNNYANNAAAAGGIVGYSELNADVFKYCYSTAVCTKPNNTRDHIGAIVGSPGADVDVISCYGASDVGGSANTLIGEYSSGNHDGISGGGMVTGATLKTYCFPARGTQDCLNAGGYVYFKDTNTNAGYPVFKNEYSFLNHYNQYLTGKNYYDSRTSLSAYSVINARDPELFDALNTANNNILSYLMGSPTSDATTTSQYVAVTNAINAIKTANTNYTALLNKISEADTFYSSMDTLPGWGGISKYEHNLVVALDTAIGQAEQYATGKIDTGTYATHIAAIETAMQALRDAGSKYVNANYAPKLTLSAPGLIFVSGNVIPETQVVLTSTYQLGSTGKVTATNGTDNYTLTYVSGSFTESGSGENKVWKYTFTITGAVTDPATAGTLTFTATGTANGQAASATAQTSCSFVESPAGKNQVTAKFSYAHEKDNGLWTDGHAYLFYNFYVSGLHTLTYTERNSGGKKTTAGENNSLLYTAAEDHSGSQSTKTFNDKGMFYGGFYCDLNLSNTFAVANGATTLTTVKFRPENNLGAGNDERVYFGVDNEEYSAINGAQVITPTGQAAAFTAKMPSETPITPEGVTVTYTLTGYATDESAKINPHEASFTITYYFVDSTKLWLLYKSEEALSRFDYNAFYRETDEAAWNEYAAAYLNAVQVLQGGVSQETIDNAYTALCTAIAKLKGKINYDKNGATSGTVTTPQYVPIYNYVEVTAANEVYYDYAIVDLSTEYTNLFKRGYLCQGWATTASKTQSDYPNNRLTMNASRATAAFTLYAAWKPITYTLQYNANPPSGTSATGTMQSQSCTYNVDLTISANTFIVTNYKFVEWNLKPDGSGTSYTPGQVVRNFSSTNGDTITLYAIWETAGVQITFNRNRSKDGIEIEVLTGPTSTYPRTLAIGSVVDLTTSEYQMTAVGYVHIGWATNSSATTPNFTTSYTVPNTSQTLHAVWVKKTVDVSYTTNGGTLSGSGYTTSNTAVEYQGTVDLPNADQITRPGYTLTGWRSSIADANGTTFFASGTNYVVPDATGTITFSAEWVERDVTYTLHHNNSADADYVTTFSGKYNATLSASNFATPTAMEGYTFVAWYVKDGTGYKKYTVPATFPADDVELYAGWSMDALSAQIQRFPSDIDGTGVYPSTGATVYYYQEPGRTNAKTELTEANAVFGANDGMLYDYTKITPTNTATTELATAIDALIETPADYTDVDVYVGYYAEILDVIHILTDEHRHAGKGPAGEDTFTSDSFLVFENATDIFRDYGIKNQSAVNAYAAALQAAYIALDVKGADYTEFNFFVNEALKFNKDFDSGETSIEPDMLFPNTEGYLYYESGSWENFYQTVALLKLELEAVAEEMNGLTTLDQYIIDDYVAYLNELWPLELLPADFSEYLYVEREYIAYDSIENKVITYTVESYQRLVIDINNSPDLFTKEYIEAVNAADRAVSELIGNTTLRDDQERVNAAIKALEDLLYSGEGYKTYKLMFMMNDGTDTIAEQKDIAWNAEIRGNAPENPIRDGYDFLGWYTTAEDTADSVGTPINFETTQRIMGVPEGGVFYVFARWAKQRSAYTLDVSTTYSNVYVKFDDGAETLQGNKYTNDEVLYGTKVILRAVADGENREFMYWKDNRNRIVSYEETLMFTLEADRYLTAVYSEAEGEGYYSVVFVDSILKTILKEQKVALNASAEAPEIAQIHGEYTFKGWNKSFDVVTGNMVITSVYVLGEQLFTITTNINGTVTEETYRYNSPVTVTIAEEEIPEGKVFAGWSLDGGKTIANYDKTYKFFAYKNMTVTAVFADAEVKAEATVTIETAIKEQTGTTYKAEFMVTRSVPEDYVFVSSGLLLTQSADLGTNENLTFETQTENTSTIRLYRTVHTGKDGQYQLTVKTSSGKTFYARGYVVYIDSNGDLITLYTDVVAVTDK